MEEWRSIIEHPDYEVSNLGNVRSYKNYKNKNTNGTHPLRPIFCPTPTVILYSNGKATHCSIAQLVYEAFSESKAAHFIKHIDNNKHNGEFSNLRDYPIPERSRPKKGHRRGETHPNAKLTDERVIEARKLVSEGTVTITELSQKYGVSVSGLWRAVVGKTWKGAGMK